MLASLTRIALALVGVYLLSQVLLWALRPKAERQAERLVAEIARQGPKQLTPDLRLLRAELQERQLRLVFEMDAQKARALDPQRQQDHFRLRLCSDAQSRAINETLDVVYLIEAGGLTLHRLRLPPRSCP